MSETQRKAVNYFYARLRTVYGSRFKAQFPGDADIALSKQEWAGQVMNLSRDDIERGVEKLKGLLVANDPAYQWIDIPKLAALCHPQPEDFGLPDTERAWMEAQSYCHVVDKHRWSHSAVRMAGKRTGWFDIMNLSSESARKALFRSFKGHYEYLVGRIMRGQALKDAPMLIERDGQQKKDQTVAELNLNYHDQKQKEAMQAMGINPAGGRAEFKRRMRGI